jgi:hypothetical protein
MSVKKPVLTEKVEFKMLMVALLALFLTLVNEVIGFKVVIVVTVDGASRSNNNALFGKSWRLKTFSLWIKDISDDMTARSRLIVRIFKRVFAHSCVAYSICYNTCTTIGICLLIDEQQHRHTPISSEHHNFCRFVKHL